MTIFVLIMFALMYVLIIAFPKYKPHVTGLTALILTVSLIISKHLLWHEVFTSAINYNVVMMLVGIMITVGLFSESNMPNKLSEKIIARIPNAMWVLVIISLLSGVISAFVDNVATVLMLAPIGFAIAKKVGISPIPVLISIAVSSNLQGAATLVGDTTSVMLGGFANMSFMEFFFLDGKFSMFWAVEIGALLTVPVLIFIFRKQNKKFEYIAEKVEITTMFPTVMLILNITCLVLCSFINIPQGFVAENINGLLCLFFGVVCLVYHIVTAKKTEVINQDGIKTFAGGKKQALKTILGTIDFPTVLFLVFLFIIIQAVEAVGIIDAIASFFVTVGSKNIFLLYTLIVFASVLISAFIDNIPYVATMLPVIQGLVLGLNAPASISYLLYFGLLCGATLGGNITPVGASANVVAIGMLGKEGYKVKSSDFFKIGIPFTLVAVLGGYLFTWFVWGM